MRSVLTLFLAVSIVKRINHAVAIIEPDPNALAVDTGPIYFTDDEVSSDDCPNYNVDLRSNGKLRARGDICGTNLERGTPPDGGSPANELVNPKIDNKNGRGSNNPGGNPPADNPDEEHFGQQPNPNDPTTPEEQPPLTEFYQNPHLECLRYLGGRLKYAVCDSGRRDDIIWSPLPEVMDNVPFFELHHCSLVLITGPSSGGIGAETAIALAAGSPALIILAGRSLTRIQSVIDEIKSSHPHVATRFLPLDLGSQASVREAATTINADIEKIDLLINNAGTFFASYSKTVDGIESQFGTSHIGHFLFTNLILGKVLAAGAGARIVNVSSSAHRYTDVRLDDWNFQDGKSFSPSLAYGQAKTANILFTVSLAKRLQSKHIYSFSLHPGYIRTNLQKELTPEIVQESFRLHESNTGQPMIPSKPKTLQSGSSTTLVAALDPSLESQPGAYLEDCAVARPETYAVDVDHAEKLWALSEDLVGEKF